MSPPEPTLSVVIALRDRGGVRVDNCLRSIRWQDLPAEEVELILSDFGSDRAHQKELRSLAEANEARVLHTVTSETWNKSRALNIGIRAARGRYILCTDCDMVFAPNFLSTLLDTQRAEDDRAFVLCQSRDLPASWAERRWSLSDLETLIEGSSYRARPGTGACQMATRAFFEELRGYDEGYRGWGQEDSDMTYRAGRAGRVLRWVEDQTAMMHQWHPSNRRRWPIQKTLNDLRFHLTKRQVRKNPGGWGLAP